MVLYNKIVFLSRNKSFYTKFDLSDSFQNRIHLMFFHISFLNIKAKQSKITTLYKVFFQNLFEILFNKIDQNMREIGYGDVVVNKSMKNLVSTFYNILLKCENYKKSSDKYKNSLFINYLRQNNKRITSINPLIIDYFNKYEAFCFALDDNSVIKGELNFNYE